MPRAVAWTEDELARIRAWREGGVSIREIARRVGRATNTVSMLLVRNGWSNPRDGRGGANAFWTPHALARLEALAGSGMSRNAMKAALGVHHQKLIRGLAIIGTDVRVKRAWTKAEIMELAILRAHGATVAEIADRLGRSPWSVRTRIKRGGLPLVAAPEPKPRTARRAATPALSRADLERIDALAGRGFTAAGITRLSGFAASHVERALAAREARLDAARTARRNGAALDGITLRRAATLLEKGWQLPDVARQVRVEPKVLEAALRDLAPKEAVA